MIKLSRTGVGVVSNDAAVRDSRGTGLLPVQADGDGATTFRVTGRVSPSAPWVEIKAPGTADWLEAISWVPYLQLEVTVGTGTVDLYIGEN
jgi:hypothetical protein